MKACSPDVATVSPLICQSVGIDASFFAVDLVNDEYNLHLAHVSLVEGYYTISAVYINMLRRNYIGGIASSQDEISATVTRNHQGNIYTLASQALAE